MNVTPKLASDGSSPYLTRELPVQESDSESCCSLLRQPIGKLEGRSCLVAGALSLILTANPAYAVLSCGISLLASRIDRVVSPLFRSSSTLQSFFNAFGSCATTLKLITKVVTVLTIANFVLAAIAPFIGVAIEISILSGIVFSLIINAINLIAGRVVDPFANRPEGTPYTIFIS
jgi:hypothetical protein